MARDSGQWRGKCFVRGRRVEVRHALFVPALVKARFNPDLRLVFQALTAAGKPPKVAIVAVTRKLVVFANPLLRKSSP